MHLKYATIKREHSHFLASGHANDTWRQRLFSGRSSRNNDRLMQQTISLNNYDSMPSVTRVYVCARHTATNLRPR